MIEERDITGWPASDADAFAMRRADIDVTALRDNAAAIRRHVAAGVEIMAMVKANGYGHGAVAAAEAFLAGGATRLGVSSPEEALQLRDFGIETPILNVNWTHPSRVASLIWADVESTVVDRPGVAAAVAGARGAGEPARVHLKVDTGMGRLGARLEDADALLDEILASDDLQLTGVFTHFADADGLDVAFLEGQHARFVAFLERVRDRAPGLLAHCANSAATLRMPHMHHDCVRPGIALYGYPPLRADPGVALRGALTLAAPVTQVKTVQAGDTVGYGRTWTAERPTRVATVGAGYGDGVHRAQSNRGVVLIHGERCSIIGRVSMDQVTVDVTALGDVQPGDECVFIGRQGGAWLGADEVAAVEETISYEVLCSVSARVSRRLIEGT